MKVTILGCGGSAGVPMIGGREGGVHPGIWGVCDPLELKNYRTRSSIMIEQEGFRLLIDTSPDLRYQLLRAGISSCDAVLYTHAHSDHIAGLDELRAINRVIERPLALWGWEDVLNELKKRFAYAFQEWDGKNFFRPVFDVHRLNFSQEVKIGPLKGRIFPQYHGRIMSMGMRFGDFAYCTDVVEFPEEAFEVLKGVRTWVVGCFQLEPHSAHASLNLVVKWYKLLQPEKVILTHMGTDMDYKTLCDRLPEAIIPAWDGMVLDDI